MRSDLSIPHVSCGLRACALWYRDNQRGLARLIGHAISVNLACGPTPDTTCQVAPLFNELISSGRSIFPGMQQISRPAKAAVWERVCQASL